MTIEYVQCAHRRANSSGIHVGETAQQLSTELAAKAVDIREQAQVEAAWGCADERHRDAERLPS